MRSSVGAVDAGLDVGQHARRLRAAAAALTGVGVRGRGSRRARPAARCWKSASACLGLLEGDVAPLHQRLGVELADASAAASMRLVHERLRVARVVALVVTVAPVADHVDHDVLVERLAVLVGQPGHAHARLGVVAVHVEDRRLDHLGDVGGVLRRAGGLGRGGEAELVVDDQVDRAADAVAR